jgi:hypothetical protein
MHLLTAVLSHALLLVLAMQPTKTAARTSGSMLSPTGAFEFKALGVKAARLAEVRP